MATAAQQARAFAAKASPPFREAYAGVGRLVRATFPKARPAFAYRMPGWSVPVPPARRPPPRGTMDPSLVLLLMADGKRGVTLHVWNPVEYDLLQRRAKELAAAGFQVMVGCLQFHRKAPYPLDAVRDLLAAVRDSLR